MEAEMEIIQPQTQECLEPAEARRGKEEFSPTAFGGNLALPTHWLQTSSLQNVREYVSVVLSHPALVGLLRQH